MTTPLIDNTRNTSDHMAIFNRAILALGIIVFVSILISFAYTIFFVDRIPLRQAAQKGDLAEVKRLVESGETLEYNARWGYNPLSLALIHQHIAVAIYLIEKGASVEGALLDAIGTKDTTVINMVVRRGARAEPNDLAVAFSRDLIKQTSDTLFGDVLLNYGANINAKLDRGGYLDGYAALHIAVYDRNTALVQYLVARGANINLLNKWGETALSLAASSYRTPTSGGPGIHYYRVIPPSEEIAEFLRQRGGR